MSLEKTSILDTTFDEGEAYTPTNAERKFIGDAYRRLFECHSLRHEEIDLLGSLTIQEFWDQSERDFAVVLDEVEDENDPVKQYQSTVSRDKSNVFIAHIMGNMMYSDAIAQHPEQGIDRMMGRVGSSLLYWAYRNDGWPSETGQQKNSRLAHSMVVRGTSATLDIVSKNGLTSEEIPIEELYVPTFWQPDIQKMPFLIRSKINILHEEAEQMFGDLENFKYVRRVGWESEFVTETPALKEQFEGIIQSDKATVLYIWKQASHKELEQLKKKRKVNSKATRACYYNVIINDVLMFPVDNISPFKHGYYPISKGIFEMFARSDFFYGNSCPNKMREDKKWKDDWKTLMRFKGKLAALRPQLIIGGSLDEQIILPSAQTSVPEGVEVKAVEGIEGITNSDIQLMQMTDAEIDRSTVSGAAAGQRPDSSQTARAEVIQAQNASKMLEPFLQQFAFFMQSRSFHILLSLFQMLPRGDLKKIAVPDQTLEDGMQGTFEILFRDFEEPGTKAFMEESMELMKKNRGSRGRREPTDTAYVKPKYYEDIKFYLFSDATAGLQDKNLLRAMDFQKDLELFLQRPEFVPAEVLREYVRMKGYPERLLAGSSQKPQGVPLPPQATGPSVPEGATPGGQAVSNASKVQTGEALPELVA